MRVPITSSKYYVASAAVAISCKLHDTYRQPDKIALAGCNIRSAARTVTETSDVFWQWRDQLLYREELLLRFLNFELNIDFPYKLQNRLVEVSEDTEGDFGEKGEEIVKKAVSMLELVSALPILIFYNVEVVLATMLVYQVMVSKDKYGIKRVPSGLISKVTAVDVNECFQCYKWTRLALSHCNDPKDRLCTPFLALAKSFKSLTLEEFAAVANF
ncbi:hypothetical protein PSN45_002068 [Yamadazyma tenuis]|nr:hypothetical protein PSN45_002068 [Yamadazyma tenuis]